MPCSNELHGTFEFCIGFILEFPKRAKSTCITLFEFTITAAQAEVTTTAAAPHVISQILNTQSTQVDAYSGATYSSDAIMAAVAAALDMARK